MSLSDEISALQQDLDELSRAPDEELATRYAMRQPRRPPGLYCQLRWLAGRVLRLLESLGILPSDPWPVSLEHAGTSKNARPLFIWAVGVGQGTLRKACYVFSGLLASLPGFAPVLVTDVADFAFYSRLGWLVEYVPHIEGVDESFRQRKAGRCFCAIYWIDRYLPRIFLG